MSSRAAQKAQAREARLAAEQALQAAGARRRRLAILGGVLAAAAAIVAVAIAVSQAATTEARPAAERAALLAGVPQDGPWLGSPSAPVVVEEYVDLQCPFCASFATGELPGIVRDYVRSGRVRLRLQLLTFLGEDSVRGARMAVAAGLQDRQWQFVEAFFAEQGAENSGYATDAFLRERAAEVQGLDAERMEADSAGPEVTRALETSQAAATAAKVESTPSFRVGRRGGAMTTVDGANLRRALDAALASR